MFVDRGAQRLRGRQGDLDVPLDDGLVLRMDVRRDGDDLRQAVRQGGQGGAESVDSVIGAHDEADEQLAVSVGGDDDELELARARVDVIGHETCVGDEPGEVGHDVPDRPFLDGALAQVDGRAPGQCEPERRSVDVAADGELHLVAKRGRARCGGGEPCLGRHSCGEGVLDGRLLARELLVVRHGQVRARAARTDVEIVAVHALSGGR